jgi:hypothetical protein
MAGNVALDVVISLIFIYLLYSLYATVLMEIIASSLKLRAKNLAYALSRMMKDEEDQESPPFKRIPSAILNSLIRVWGKAANLTHPVLYQRFFKHPSVKSLTNGGLNNKPSYISPSNFSKCIIDAIKIDDPDLSILARIEIGLQDPNIGPQTKAQIQSLLDEANNDLTKFRILLEEWYNDTMERATGWYKRSTQLILIALGFVLAISFNVDTLQIIRKLSVDKDAREQLVKMASDFSNNNGPLIEGVRNQKTIVTDSSVKILNARLDSLQQIRMSLKEDTAKSQSILSSTWNIPDSIQFYKKQQEKVHKDSIQLAYTLDSIGVVYLIVHKSLDSKTLKKILSKKSKNTFLQISPLWYKLRYVFSAEHFWGYFLTVLALSLGAPFWFDLLNKLVKLRSSKAIPTDAGGGTSASNTTTVSSRVILNRAG